MNKYENVSFMVGHETYIKIKKSLEIIMEQQKIAGYGN